MASLPRPSSLARMSPSPRLCRISNPHAQSKVQLRHVSGVSSTNLRNMPRQQSLANRMKNLKKSEIPSDIGLVPHTYIRPSGSLPITAVGPELRLKLEWLYVKQTFQDFMQAFYTRRWAPEHDPLTGKKKKIPWGRSERYQVARDLHTKLYTAIANADRATIRQITCSGLENQQLGRLDRRRILKEPAESWTVKYNGWVLPRWLYFPLQNLIPSWFKAIAVVADREAQLPIGNGVMVRQVIVRIDSKQTRDKKDGSDPITKSLREYMVLQQTTVEGKADEWRVWGTVDPTSLADARKIIQDLKDLAMGAGIMDKIRAMMSGAMPR